MSVTVLATASVFVPGCGSSGATSAHATVPTTVPVPDATAPHGVPKLDVHRWQHEWSTTPGTSLRRCVAVGRSGVVRSHALIVGNFAAYRHDWDGTLERSKLWYVPLFPGDMSALRVSAQPLGAGPPIPTVVEWQSQAWGSTGDFFYATGTVLPHRGTWRLIATTGRNWGCVDLTL